MFNSLHVTSFGQYLKAIRVKLKLTQAFIQETTGLNVDTIRRIENGQVVPKYETMAVLSSIYKVDLIKKFSEYTVEPTLVMLYSEIDRCLLNYDINGLKQLTEYIANETINIQIKEHLIVIQEFEQFQIYLSVLLSFMQQDSISVTKNIDRLAEALNLTIKNFSMKNYHRKMYNAFELRILLLYALLWRANDQVGFCNDILLFIDKWLSDMYFDAHTAARYKIKLYFNIAFNYHLLSQYELSLKYADMGIAVGKSMHLYDELYGLYFRKFTAEWYLKQPNAIDSLKTALFIMKLLGNEQLRDTYIKSAKSQYGITDEDLR